MFKNIKNIIFDLDETLLNENTYRENCLKIIGYLKLKKFKKTNLERIMIINDNNFKLDKNFLTKFIN